MVAEKIETLLKQSMGLDAASIGSASIERAARVRSTACGTASLGDYWQRLTTSPVELQELIEAVVVPETWFFRDREAFVELARIACDAWLPNAAGARRILSLPCSTGEEPYSIAMALLDAGYPNDGFAIDAIDISERSLAHARSAIYGRNSFRGTDLAFCERHFQRASHGHRLNDAVRRTVRFEQGNIQSDGFLARAEPYDAIFCRNLLIYFDEATQAKAIAVLQRLLSPAGVLFVGPAEAGLLLNHGFVSAKVPLAFAFRRAQPAPPPAVSAPPRRPNAVGVEPKVRSSPKPAQAIDGATTAQSPASASAIDQAFALADQGRLMEAAALCETHLREHGPTAQAYYLLGLIGSADGRVYAADRCYRKALFLDKNHRDALTHLALLLEQQGDMDEAKLLRARAQRL